MPWSTNQIPNVQASEVLNHGFDFSRAMAAGTAIVTATVTLTVAAGTDPTPATRVNGGATINSQLVIVSIGPFPNVTSSNVVTYTRTCLATGSDGQIYELQANFTVDP